MWNNDILKGVNTELEHKLRLNIQKNKSWAHRKLKA